jgi:hypothetical protein
MVVCGFLFLPLRKDEELVLSSNVLFFILLKSFYSWIGFLPLLTSKVTFPSWRFVRSIPSFVSFLLAPHYQNESPFFQKTCSQVFPYCLQEE